MTERLPTAQQRYESDPNFRSLVDLFQMQIERGHFTPSELREAVILAATKFELVCNRRMIFGPDMAHAAAFRDIPQKK